MTQKQRIFFFRLFQKACDARGIPPAEREAYRHNLIAHACPVSGGSLRHVGSGTEFDRLMRAVAREAQSLEATGHFADAGTRRVAKMCEACARQIFEITRVEDDAVAYLRGILAQAGWRWAIVASGDCWWLDLPAPHAHKLFQMLDTHRRRLLRRFEGRKRERRADGSERAMRLAFDLECAYRWEEGTLFKEPLEALPEPRVRVRVTA